MSKYKITIGADPEFFVIDKAIGEVVPACRKFGGEKRAPMFLSPDGGFLEDGTTVEFNVTPSATLKETKKKIENLILIFLNKYDKYEISKVSAGTFDQKELQELPEAMQIGCSPDLYAYGLRVSPSIEKFGNRRFAGGHIHLGIDPWPEGLEKDVIIKYMDLLLVCPVASRFCNQHRYPFYGHPGLYRETAYGVEHRSPDNWWCNPALEASLADDTRKFIHDTIDQFDGAITRLYHCLEFDEHGARVNHELRKVIKDCNLETIMPLIGSTEDPGRLRNYRIYGREAYLWADREWALRRPIYQNRQLGVPPVAAKG